MPSGSVTQVVPAGTDQPPPAPPPPPAYIPPGASQLPPGTYTAQGQQPGQVHTVIVVHQQPDAYAVASLEFSGMCCHALVARLFWVQIS